MIRGIRKDMIHMKPRGSRYFEEVLFILRPQSGRLREEDRRSMVAEAHRILRESQPRGGDRAREVLIPFFWGLLGGSLSVGLIWLITLLAT